MVLSMTGYGRGRGSFGDRNIEVEIKSLNGKVTDLRIKLPAAYKEKELPIRNLILSGSHRGKLEAIINLESEDGDTEYGLNKQLFKKYHQELTELSGELKINNADLIQSILRIPNVIQTPDYEMSEEEWKTICKITEEAIYNLNLFRKEEGKAMEDDLRLRIKEIVEHLELIGPHEESRLSNLKERMLRNLRDNDVKEQVDPNRFEQEVMYYLERLDVSEEKVRLKQHCDFFLEVMGSEKKQKGKKLSFISQEMGREINTLGAKAQYSPIQKIVVVMKDELEKIKEQLANVV